MSAGDPILQTIDLVKVYRSGKVDVPALLGVDIAIERGEFVAIMGPSGCGKSTLLHLLGGLDRPTSGRVLLDGVDLSISSDGQRTRLRRDLVGFVFQRFNLLPTLTVLGNLEVARAIHSNGRKIVPAQQLTDTLELVGLGSKMHRRPMELSLGEQQRVAIARALIHKPSIVLADEPTGNLDSVNSDNILRLLQDLNGNLKQTIVMITHNPEAAATGHRTIEMRDGKVVRGGAASRHPAE
ncbi:MAG: ABC transporter ATP-binding protein [Acidobacteria bacterium]|nr:ABC transporter ATP-binding protein [Acidobacteriota bacterium]